MSTGKKVFVTISILASLCLSLAATESQADASPGCNSCLAKSCSFETDACATTNGCLPLLQCVTSCTAKAGTTPAFCVSLCEDDYSGRAQLAAEAILTCAASKCGRVCQ